MDYQLEHDYRDDLAICFTSVKGFYRRPDDAFAIVQSACAFGKSRACERYLFDMRQATPVGGTFALYEFGEGVGLHGFDRRFKASILYPHVSEEEQFLENFFQNRAYRVRVYDEESAAIEWLKGS